MKIYEKLYQTILLEHEKVFAAQDIKELDAAMEEIASANRIFITGAGREGIAARGFAMRLMHLGKEVHWLWDDTTPGMKPGDLFIAINGSGSIGHIDYPDAPEPDVLSSQEHRRNVRRQKRKPVSLFLRWYIKGMIRAPFHPLSQWGIFLNSICSFSLIFLQ